MPHRQSQVSSDKQNIVFYFFGVSYLVYTDVCCENGDDNLRYVQKCVCVCAYNFYSDKYKEI